MKVEVEGKRIYVVGNTYPLRAALKQLGARWDPERAAWWAGVTKREAIEALLRANPNPTEQRDEAQRSQERLERDRDNILGRAEYKGKSYYFVGEGVSSRGPWIRLMFRDGSKTFFASADDVTISARYRRPQTLVGLQEYAARMKREAAGGECECRCHRSCDCSRGFCLIHHDGCEYCGCEG
jgi:hypothetical protein